MKAISLFTGAGGLDIGCEAAGFKTVAAVENNRAARRTLGLNRARCFPELEAESILDDIVTLDLDELLDRAGAQQGEVALVHGGPPCTPFSKSGYWLAYKRAGEDPKASLLDNYLDVVEHVKPMSFLLENVFALAYGNQNRPVLTRFLERAEQLGYALDKNVILAGDYGIPQLRQRFMVVGIRKDLLDVPGEFWQLSWPSATHAGPHETRKGYDSSLPPHVTATEAFAGLTDKTNPPEPEEIVTGTYLEELKGVPPGENYLFWTEKRGHPEPRFKWRSRYWTFLLKLHPDRPAPTIQGQPGPWVGPFHWDNRRLRVAELKRLMDFPDDFEVAGSRRDQQLQLGNAVPPGLGRVVAAALREELARLGVEAQPVAA